MSKSYHIIYLLPHVQDENFAHLHKFLHPGNKDKNGWLSMFCADIDMSHHIFLRCIAKSYSGGSRELRLRYDLVGQDEFPEQPEDK
jgi:hypothetical protein